MAHKLKLIAAGLALAGASTVSQAALFTGNEPGETAGGDLFFIALDAKGRTFVKDLGVRFSTIAANSTSTTWFSTVNLGSLVTPGDDVGNFDFGDGLQWNIASASQNLGDGNRTSSNNGVFATVNADTRFNPSTGADRTNLQTATTSAGFNQGNVRLNNQIVATVNKASVLNTSTDENPAVANEFPTTVKTDSDFYVFSDSTGPRTFGDTWGDDFNDKSTFKTSATLANGEDSTLLFFQWFLDLPDAANPAVRAIRSVELPGLWTLTQEGVLSYASPAPIPVPAAAWMFGSAVASLAAMRRRRSAN